MEVYANYFYSGAKCSLLTRRLALKFCVGCSNVRQPQIRLHKTSRNSFRMDFLETYFTFCSHAVIIVIQLFSFSQIVTSFDCKYTHLKQSDSKQMR